MRANSLFGFHPQEMVNEAITKKIGLHINYSKEDIIIPFCLVKKRTETKEVSQTFNLNCNSLLN